MTSGLGGPFGGKDGVSPLTGVSTSCKTSVTLGRYPSVTEVVTSRGSRCYDSFSTCRDPVQTAVFRRLDGVKVEGFESVYGR